MSTTSTPVSMVSPSPITSSTLSVAIVFPILASIAVVLRFYIRCKTAAKFQADDWTILVALICCWLVSIPIFVASSITGLNTTTMNPLSASEVTSKMVYAESFSVMVAVTLFKISVLIFYKRVFVMKRQAAYIYAFIVVLSLWCLSYLLCETFATWPVGGIFDPVDANYLYNYPVFQLTFAGMSIFFDLVILCIPIPIIWRLNMKTWNKIAIIGILWLGAFCVVAAALRLYYVDKSLFVASNPTTSPEESYTIVANSIIWVTIEPNTSVIAACLPNYGPFFKTGSGLKTLIDRCAYIFSNASRLIRTPSDRAARSEGSSERSHPNQYELQGAKTSAWMKLDESQRETKVEGFNQTTPEDLESGRDEDGKIFVRKHFTAEY